MKFVKPNWVSHSDDKQKRLPIFSLHVHPDGTRLATGGLDAKVKIWSTLPITDSAHDNAVNPKLLCTMTQHDGTVLSVRWAHHGSYLATGSDDKVVVIWYLDPRGGGKNFGSDEVNIENWIPKRRLVAHGSDVVDLAWSRDDRKLATVGLDSMVCIWNTGTWEQTRKISQHGGFVKGVCWDPAGEYLATQSDDKSVKIWRTSDWGLQTTVTEPFNNSPGSTFFRRLSWSPDGAFIASSNAMSGPIFVAAIIERHDWSHKISFVGHENTVEVTAFSPRVFLKLGDKPSKKSISSMVALGSDDRSISIWRNNAPQPVVVAKEVFDRSILDLSWSDDGLHLYGCSSDGTICALSFTADEVTNFAPPGALEEVLSTYAGFSRQRPAKSSAVLVNANIMPLSSTLLSSATGPTSAEIQVVGPSGSGSHPEKINVLVAKKGKPKVQTMAVKMTSTSNIHKNRVSLNNSQETYQQQQQYQPPPLPQHRSAAEAIFANAANVRPLSGAPGSYQDALPFNTSNNYNNNYKNYENDVSLSNYSPLYSNNINNGGPGPGWDFGNRDFEREGSLNTPSGSNKRKATGEEDSGRGPRARTLGGGSKRSEVEQKILRPAAQPGVPSDTVVSVTVEKVFVPLPALQTVVKAVEDESNPRADRLEVRNSITESPTEVTCLSSGNRVEWSDCLPSPVLCAAMSSVFSAVACEDKSITVYTSTGRRRMPNIVLEQQVSILIATGDYLMAITAAGSLHVWSIKKCAAHFQPVSLAHLFHISDAEEDDELPIITQSSLRPNGAPLILFDTGFAFTYDASMNSLFRISDIWWAEGSTLWESGRASRQSTASTRGVIAGMEAALSEHRVVDVDPPQRPEWWETAMTLGHLETRLQAAVILDSPQEYKLSLNQYAKKLGEEGFRSKAEELVRELFGPVYHKPGKEETWEPTILGVQKRELLREVLNIFVRGSTLVKLGQDWLDLLKKSNQETLF